MDSTNGLRNPVKTTNFKASLGVHAAFVNEKLMSSLNKPVAKRRQQRTVSGLRSSLIFEASCRRLRPKQDRSIKISTPEPQKLAAKTDALLCEGATTALMEFPRSLVVVRWKRENLTRIKIDCLAKNR